MEKRARLKAEVEPEREIKRQRAELKKNPTGPKNETSSPKSVILRLDRGIDTEFTRPVDPVIKSQDDSFSEPVSPSSGILSSSSQTLIPAPKPLLKPADAKALKQLLQYVVEGEQDKAEEMLKGKLGGLLGFGAVKANPDLLLYHGTVTDLSGREFKQITAFQYALWAMDYHMWTMIQKYLPKEAQAEQLQALESKGTAHGHHFSLKELTDALQVYMDMDLRGYVDDVYDQRA
ncbi:MAG: hypothetical protein JSR33_11715 [Proteobacteria bacterium]|nr:hypothetical protein [Pseudomonadota bacterium]